MNDELLKSLRGAIDAKLSGKPWQYRPILTNEANWMDAKADTQIELIDYYEYRAKPEPVSRPWNCPADVPGPVCWLRSDECSIEALMVSISEKGFEVYSGSNLLFVTWDKFKDISASHSYRHSTDRKEWKKCEVTEPAQ